MHTINYQCDNTTTFTAQCDNIPATISLIRILNASDNVTKIWMSDNLGLMHNLKDILGYDLSNYTKLIITSNSVIKDADLRLLTNEVIRSKSVDNVPVIRSNPSLSPEIITDISNANYALVNAGLPFKWSAAVTINYGLEITID